MNAKHLLSFVFLLFTSLGLFGQFYLNLDSVYALPSKMVENDTAYVRLVGHKTSGGIKINGVMATINGFTVDVLITVSGGISFPGSTPWDTIVKAGKVKAGKYNIKISGLYVQDLSSSAMKKFTVLPITSSPDKIKNMMFLSDPMPNPFKSNTVIRYTTSGNNSELIVTDLRGRVVRIIQLSGNDHGSVRINGLEYNKGIYFYTLYTDGLPSRTKRLVIF